MQFEPITKQEADEAGLLPAGLYEATVESAEHYTSKSGNEMILLRLKVYTPAGAATEVKDYLMGHAMRHKLRHFCEVIGRADLAESGKLEPEDCIGHTVLAKIRIQEPKGDYRAKNEVADYWEQKGDIKPGLEKQDKPDDLPF